MSDNATELWLAEVMPVLAGHPMAAVTALTMLDGWVWNSQEEGKEVVTTVTIRRDGAHCADWRC